MNTSTLNADALQSQVCEIASKLRQRLQNTSWYPLLRVWLYGNELDEIIRKLIQDREKGFRFTPPLNLLLRPFEECELSELKLVILAGVPYDGIDLADGLIFSASKHKKMPDTLRAFFDIISQSEAIRKNPPLDLTYLANQGVLLLPVSLTRRISPEYGTSKTYAHQPIWNDFMALLIDSLSRKFPQLLWVLMGPAAQAHADLLNSQAKIFEFDYPGSTSKKAVNNHQWSEINTTLVDQGFTPIAW